MHTTEPNRRALASCRTPARITPRLEMRRRLVALVELFTDAPRKPAAIYDVTRRAPRCQLPDEKHRALIHDGIRAGLISRERIVRYRAQQLLDDFAQFPDEASAKDALYVRLMFEAADCVKAQTVAQGMPTEGNCLDAVRETRELIAVAELQCCALLPTHPLSMGAPR